MPADPRTSSNPDATSHPNCDNNRNAGCSTSDVFAQPTGDSRPHTLQIEIAKLRHIQLAGHQPRQIARSRVFSQGLVLLLPKIVNSSFKYGLEVFRVAQRREVMAEAHHSHVHDHLRGVVFTR